MSEPGPAALLGATNDLSDLIATILVSPAGASDGMAEAAVFDSLRGLQMRLADGRFQLAVVGQFKRGKSTLLNALLQIDVLPVGIVPLTALPTFIIWSDAPSLKWRFDDGRVDRWSGHNLDELRRRLTDLVTETGNPLNEKKVTAVELGLPSPLLADGLVLIDTPGIGSLARHNTEVATAALPECDAALFVLSPDPPMTKTELIYLRRVRANAALVIPVLNKVDTVGDEDRTELIAYLANVFDQQELAGQAIAMVAARSAIQSSKAQDADAREASGIVALDRRIRLLVGDTRRDLLSAAIALKAASLLKELSFHNDVALAALSLPVAELAHRLDTLHASMSRLKKHDTPTDDLISGERRRLFDLIDNDADALRARSIGTLGVMLDRVLAESESAAFARLATEVAIWFETAFAVAVDVQHERLRTIFAAAQEATTPTLTRIRQIANEVLGIEFRVPAPTEMVPLRESLAWAVRPEESMNPLPPGLIEAILPAALRQRRRRVRLQHEIDRLVRLNVERLRWELRQSADGALRRFQSELAAMLSAASASITDTVDRVAELRARKGQLAEQQIVQREERARRLQESIARLGQRSAPS